MRGPVKSKHVTHNVDPEAEALPLKITYGDVEGKALLRTACSTHLSSVPRGQTERDIPYPSGKAVEFEQKLIQEVAHRVRERGYPGLSHSSFILALSDA